MGLCKGTYQVRIIDADNDTIFIQSFVHTHNNLGVTATIVNPLCDTCAAGQITVNAAGGNPPYTYSFESGPFSSTNVYDSLMPGTYLINVLDSCGTLVTLSVTIVNAVGINEINAENTINVYPNPVSQQLTVTFGLGILNRSKTVTIVNQIGSVIYNSKLGQNVSLVEINAENFPNGVYVIKIQADNEIQVCNKFLKITN